MKKLKMGLGALSAMSASAFAGVGADAATQVGEAATEANLVYVAVIAAFAGYFVVRLILKVL